MTSRVAFTFYCKWNHDNGRVRHMDEVPRGHEGSVANKTYEPVWMCERGGWHRQVFHFKAECVLFSAEQKKARAEGNNVTLWYSRFHKTCHPGVFSFHFFPFPPEVFVPGTSREVQTHFVPSWYKEKWKKWKGENSGVTRFVQSVVARCFCKKSGEFICNRIKKGESRG